MRTRQEAPAEATDRTPRPRLGPLAGIRVADFCWMGVGSVATRLLADFGAEVIKIEDRQRIDTPRKLPIYKGEPARNFGEEVIHADPNRGGGPHVQFRSYGPVVQAVSGLTYISGLP